MHFVLYNGKYSYYEEHTKTERCSLNVVQHLISISCSTTYVCIGGMESEVCLVEFDIQM